MIITYTLDTIDAVADTLMPLINNAAIITFTGPLGAGKTTLIKAIMKKLGVTETVTSPTYTYVNQYHTASGMTLYHFDLYRITSCDDFIAAGFNEYLYQENSKVFIEWPAPMIPFITAHAIHCTMKYGEQNTVRTIECSSTYLQDTPLSL